MARTSLLRKRALRSRRVAKRSRLGLWTVILLSLLLGAYLGVLELSRPHVDGDRLRFDTFVDLVERGRVKDATILDQDAYVVGRYQRPDGTLSRYNAPLVATLQPRLVVDILLPNRVPTDIDQQVGKRVAALASLLLPGLIIVVLLAYVILSHRRGTGLFGIRSGARRITSDNDGVTFADVAGQGAAVEALKEIKEFLANPERFVAVGAQVPKGILLYGPPGCGKTMLAKALAGEAGANFYSISGSDFVEVYVGVGASRVRDLFREAREHAPSVVFIDELDSVGRARAAGGKAAVGHGEQEQALNQILAEMDGFSASDGLIVLGATNRPDVLDPALLRPGRFDRTVGLELPDEAGRLAILSVHAANKRLDPGTDLADVARRAIGLTGADLASVVNEAALLAVRAGRSTLSQGELDQALRQVLEAPERQRRLSLKDRSVGRRFAAEERVTFAQVAGVDEAIEELAEVKEHLAHPDRLARMGARAPRGILLSGPPGCGKTLLARAVAGEANAAFIYVAASEFVEVFVGEGASRVRELFAQARSLAPAIVFIDEIDAVGASRGISLDGQNEREQTLNQILVEMDGFEPSSSLIVMAATNRPDILDAALVRPGRFDRRVDVSLPDRAGRRAILGVHAEGKPLAPGVDLDVVAGLTPGFSGADLANVLNEAALLSSRRGLEHIPMAALEEAVDRALLGVASRSYYLSEEERHVVAYHEAGHAVVSLALPGATPPHKLTIMARAGAAGHCTVLDSHDRVVHKRSALMDRMAVFLAGRVAEELVSDDPGSSAAADLRRVYELARRMVCDLGMSDVVGPLAFGDDTGADGRPRTFSEQKARTIDEEIRRLVDEAHQRAEQVLSRHRPALDRVARALLDQETVTSAQLTTLVGALRAAPAATTRRRRSQGPPQPPGASET